MIGKLEISKSFGTLSFADARRLARIERVAIDQLFDDATASLMRARNSAPSDEDIRFLARSIFHRLEAGSSTVPLDPSDRDRAEEQNSEDHRMISGDVDDAGLQLVAMAAAEQAKFHVPPGTDEYSKMVHAVQRAYAEHYSRQGDRLALQSTKPQDEMFLDVSAQVPPVSRLTMSKAVELYKAAPERSKISEKTRASDRFRFAALIDIIGKDRLIADITRQDCRSAQEVLLALPANAPKKFPGIVLRDVAKMATLQQLQQMSSKSAALYVE